MKTSHSLRNFLLGSALLAGVNSAHAQKTWTGSSSVNWTATANWSPSGSPGAGADVIFDGTGANLNTSFNGTARTLNSLTFTSGQTSAVTINTTNAATLTLGPTTGNSTVLSVATGSHLFKGSNIDLLNTALYDFRFSGASGSTFTLNIDGSAVFEINGRIGANNGGTNGNRNYEKTGSGTLVFSGNNGSSGGWNFSSGSTGFTVSDGILRLAASAASGNTGNKYTVNPGSGKQSAIELTGGTTHTFNNGTITLNANGISSNGALRSLSGNNTISGTGAGGIILATDSSIGVDADSLTISQVVSSSGARNLTKVGAGTLDLSGVNTYSGTTNVDVGTLTVSSSGSIINSTAINVAAGAKFVYNSSTALTVAPTLNGSGSNKATFSGTGTVNATMTLDSIDDVISPGNSPGAQIYGVNQTWLSFSYDWELNDWNSMVAATNIDQIQITGSLDLSAVSANQYLLNILSLNSANASGLVGAGGGNTFSELNRSWNILTTTGGITGFNASEWQIVAGGFQDVETGSWSISQSGNNLVLTYTTIPEPTASLIGSLGLLALLRRRRA